MGHSSWDQAADEDRFEGYLFALMLQVAGKEGANLRFENRNGPFGSIATFRIGTSANGFSICIRWDCCCLRSARTAMCVLYESLDRPSR